jgi:SAM-dependent methyltransferase
VGTPAGEAGRVARSADLTFLDAVRSTYDAVAESYAAAFADELDHKPLDRSLIEAFARQVQSTADGSPVGDLGCGPGHTTAYLGELGLSVVGLDLSPNMVRLARERYPGIDVREGSILDLPVPDGSWAGVISLYSIIHLPRDVVTTALREFHRVLRPGGLLLLGFHAGDEQLHLDEWFGHQVSIDGYLFDPADMARELQNIGFSVDARVVRRPYPDIEVPTERAYLFARRSGG